MIKYKYAPSYDWKTSSTGISRKFFTGFFWGKAFTEVTSCPRAASAFRYGTTLMYCEGPGKGNIANMRAPSSWQGSTAKITSTRLHKRNGNIFQPICSNPSPNMNWTAQLVNCTNLTCLTDSQSHIHAISIFTSCDYGHSVWASHSTLPHPGSP